jgi:hypothetical protein
MKKTYRARVIVTPVNNSLKSLSAHDLALYYKGYAGRLDGEELRTFDIEFDIDEEESPRTKALLREFLQAQKFDDEKKFWFKVDTVREVKGAKKEKRQPVSERVVQSLEWATNELLQQEIDRRRKAAGLPEGFWPEEDEFSLKLHKSFMCPFCGGEDVNTVEYDGDRELTFTMECGDCSGRWGEKYYFAGGWSIEEPDGEEEVDEE